jgi:hypothetical protein
MSDGPPGGHGTTTVTVLLGQPCASALTDTTDAAKAQSRYLLVLESKRIFNYPLVGCPLPKTVTGCLEDRLIAADAGRMNGRMFANIAPSCRVHSVITGCAVPDDSQSNIWTNQNEFETTQHAVKVSMKWKEEETHGYDVTQGGVR